MTCASCHPSGVTGARGAGRRCAIGWQNNLFPLLIVTSGGGFSGLFIYSPGTGFGNLIESDTAKAGTDPYGDAYLAGSTTYGKIGGLPVALNDNGSVLTWYTAVTFGGPWTAGSAIGSTLNVLPDATGLQFRHGPFLFAGSTALLAPTGDVTGNQDALAIKQLFAAGVNDVTLLPGTWYVLAGTVQMNPGQSLCGSGYKETIVNGVGGVSSGAVFQQTNNGAYSSLLIGGSIGGPRGMTVDVTNMGAGSIGVQVGNFAGGHINVEVQDTSGRTPPLTGIYVLNDVHFTEQLCIQRGWAHGCTIVFDVTDGPGGVKTSTNSFKGLAADLYVNQASVNTNDGLVLQNGALWYDHSVKYGGNFAHGANPTTAGSVRITGTVPAGHQGAGAASAMRDGHHEFGLECDAGANTPRTIIFGTGANVISNCGGVMDFSAADSNTNFAASNWSGSGSFFGPILGDSSLAGLMRLAAGPLTLDKGLNIGHSAAAQALATNGTITTAGLTYAPVSLAAAVTGIIMQAGTFSGQVCYVANEAGAASGFTLTFAAAGSNVQNPVAISPGRGCLFVWNEHVNQWIQGTP